MLSATPTDMAVACAKAHACGSEKPPQRTSLFFAAHAPRASGGRAPPCHLGHKRKLPRGHRGGKDACVTKGGKARL